MTRRQLLFGTPLTLLAAAVSIGALLPAEKVPALSLQAIDGRRIDLAERQGQPLLVHFWATSCGVCLAEMPELIAFYQRYQPRGLELVAVAMPYDSPARVVNYARETTLPFPVVLDVQASATNAFGDVRLTPTTFVINGDGRIVEHLVGRLDFNALDRILTPLL
jgi:thiol-disulfide isomerase/thioredoxin